MNDRGICSAALRELVRITEDQVETVLSKEPEIWKDPSLKALLRHVQLKYIKGGKVENVATGGVEIGEFGKGGKIENSHIGENKKDCEAARHNRERHAMSATAEQDHRVVCKANNLAQVRFGGCVPPREFHLSSCVECGRGGKHDATGVALC